MISSVKLHERSAAHERPVLAEVAPVWKAVMLFKRQHETFCNRMRHAPHVDVFDANVSNDSSRQCQALVFLTTIEALN
jgi:hypothetical protein